MLEGTLRYLAAAQNYMRKSEICTDFPALIHADLSMNSMALGFWAGGKALWF